jgi:transcriptional regulator with XRE-family HTH domain
MNTKIELSFPELVGARMRAIRECFGISQAEVAEALGTDEPMISRYEAGNRMPSYAHLIQFGLGFMATPNWLLLGYADDLPPVIRTAMEREVPHLIRKRPPLLPALRGRDPKSNPGTQNTAEWTSLLADDFEAKRLRKRRSPVAVNETGGK